MSSKLSNWLWGLGVILFLIPGINLIGVTMPIRMTLGFSGIGIFILGCVAIGDERIPRDMETIPVLGALALVVGFCLILGSVSPG